MKNLNILGLQHKTIWKDVNKNLAIIENLLKNRSHDLILLPEMFATGFCMEVSEIAEKGEKILRWMQKTAKDKNSAVGGSVAVKEGGKYYNRFYFVFPSGQYVEYDKRHLFSYAGEEKVYYSGDKKVIVEYRGWKICLQVCYDLRFPVFQRNTENYDIMINVANWPSTRKDAWETLLKARAIENQCYVFGLNRMGEDGNGLTYEGNSHCFFADGTKQESIEDMYISAELSWEKLQEFRKRFPFLKDQDKFTIEANIK